MKFKELLVNTGACESSIEWAKDSTIEEVVKTCPRGDWLLRLAKRINMEIKPYTLAKVRCAQTVIHLMKDERSLYALKVAEKFALTDEVTLDDLKAASIAARKAVIAYAAYAAYTAAYTAVTDSAAAYTKNQLQTADICREYIGELLIKLVNQKLNDSTL